MSRPDSPLTSSVAFAHYVQRAVFEPSELTYTNGRIFLLLLYGTIYRCIGAPISQSCNILRFYENSVVVVLIASC